MLSYLIILLDDTSTSYCHYEVSPRDRKLIGLDDLKLGILFAMKENLNVQFIYPDYDLPIDYAKVIESIDNTKIKPHSQAGDADVIVLTNFDFKRTDIVDNSICIIRTRREELHNKREQLKTLLSKVSRLNIVLTDIEDFSDNDISSYKNLLSMIVDEVFSALCSGKRIQTNLLTDCLMVKEMNNCNAGVNNITLAPNGKFYLCPAFYYDSPRNDIGDLINGVKIRNQQLLKLDHAPICRICDAYQCKRCIWLNEKLTFDRNTPSLQQCVMSHLERNASCDLLEKLNKSCVYIENIHKIEKNSELDPFNIVNRWK